MEKVFSAPLINVFLHSGPSHNTLEVQWLDFVNSDTLRASLLEVLRLARQYQVKAYIADNRLLRALRTKDYEWMGPNVMTPLDQLGVRRLAVIDSQDAMNRMGIKSFLSEIIPDTAILSQTFTSADDARTWAIQAQ
ncbi:hypothetical protein Q5H93_05115 [Hymenobacter sp. ASUV-10]|uniref:STAS/SEC14 domain-containing protein n=1 Tax=Hymenobacter aranciens TaxID=3063996 RepID=A0ABT9B8Q9_9BACT|nr:hypothetical protein [Hymenobacter sp. ASUV-10]MDO7874104.1 hypothetical protein [Hymenobacter sp. ASUV-10]